MRQPTANKSILHRTKKMFTGIVDEIGTITNIEKCDTGLLVIIKAELANHTLRGESICVV
jgi:riboflavin synthase alpha subunit